MRIAIMQPYFIPYAGYLRLLSNTDLFVSYDCVQFPRRSWVHRNRLTTEDGGLDWLTLRLNKSPYQAQISELTIAEGAQSRLQNRLGRFPATSNAEPQLLSNLLQIDQMVPGTSASRYIEEVLVACCKQLGMAPIIERSAELHIPVEVRGSDRIIAICKHFGATHYINAPSGTDLYDAEEFEAAGIKLQFLKPYRGPPTSILERLLLEDPQLLADELKAQNDTGVVG